MTKPRQPLGGVGRGSAQHLGSCRLPCGEPVLTSSLLPAEGDRVSLIPRLSWEGWLNSADETEVEESVRVGFWIG